MYGGTIRHARVAGNAFAGPHGRLRGRNCEAFDSDTKVKVLLTTGTRFCYPDAMVVCDSNFARESLQARPGLMVDQDQPVVVAWRGSAVVIEREDFAGLKAVIPLPEGGVELPLSGIHEGVQL